MYNMIIVDDESFELELISSWTIWKKYDIEITKTFERPTDALQYVLENKVDIIISDICMSDMSGIDFLKKIKSFSNDIIFVFVTAYNNFEYMHTAIVNNAFDYIMKPIRISDIQNLCERICNKLSNDPADNEPNLSMLKCNQSIIDYFTEKQSLLDMQNTFQKNGIDFIASKNKTCILQLEIPEFAKLSARWDYNIDRLYTSILNVSKNNIFDLIPLKYNNQTIDFLVILHEPQQLTNALEIFIYECSTICKCTFNYKIISSITLFAELSQDITKILSPNSENENSKESTHFAIKLAMKYIEEHYAEDVSLSILAEHISLSPYHTSRLFKQYTGDSFVNYINQFRINKAKELILNTNKSINEIGSEIGISNKNYFTKIFRRYTGHTPTEYRNRYSD